MRCPQRETELLDGAKFCSECGHDLRQAGETAAIDYHRPHSYTPKHLKEKILTSRSAIEGERKLVKRLEAGKTDRASCVSCNRCLGAIANSMPLRCYNKPD